MKTITLFKIIAILLFTSKNYSQEGCWKQTSAGQQHTLALRNDGTIWAWGSNYHLVLGTGTGLDSHIPIQVGTDNDWKQITTGTVVNLAIKQNGTLWAWGYNDAGEFGNGTFENSAIPVQIGTENDWKEVYANGTQTGGIKNDGRLWIWGYGTSYPDYNMPTLINDNIGWKHVRLGTQHSLAIKTDNTLWTWGSNQQGQLGIPSATYTNTPIQVSPSSTWKDADRGFFFTIAIKSDGSLWAWGDSNGIGWLGNGLANGRSNIPLQIGTETNWKKVKCGINFTLAIKEDGTLWGWGSNFYGQLGDGTNVSKYSPVQIGTDTDWKELGNNDYFHTSAIKNDGSLWSWGRNFLGALGDGTLIDSNVPILVECVTLGTKENNFKSKFSIYPNPSASLISIKNPENAVINKILITDFLGKKVLETSNKEFIDVSKLSAGMYIIQIYHEGKISKEKFLKL